MKKHCMTSFININAARMNTFPFYPNHFLPKPQDSCRDFPLLRKKENNTLRSIQQFNTNS